MKTLERSELKKLTGGSTVCSCSNGNLVNCGSLSSGDCFELVYFSCGGVPATKCWFENET